MTVIITQDSPDSIRGILKRWFIEPKPQVFVGSINRSVREHVVDYLRRNAGHIRMLVIHSSPNCQGFTIEQINDPDYSGIIRDGLHLIASPQSFFERVPF